MLSITLFLCLLSYYSVPTSGLWYCIELQSSELSTGIVWKTGVMVLVMVLVMVFLMCNHESYHHFL